MANSEVTYFACGHKTNWGQISKGTAFRNKTGDLIYCRRCDTWRKVLRTVRK